MAKHRKSEDNPGTDAQQKADREAKAKAELAALEKKLRKQGKIK